MGNIPGYLIVVGEATEYEQNWEIITYNHRPEKRHFLTSNSEIEIPFDYFYYYNVETRIWIYALDDNLYDFYSTLTESSFDPEPVSMYIDGGLGIFGAIYEDSISIMVQKPFN
ncbi:MAG: DUF4249 family protein [Fidelibacterota bacterium]